MDVTIPTTVDKFFRQRLELLRLFPPYNKLRDRELDVLAALQEQYFLVKSLEPTVRHAAVFNYDVMIKIREKLNMSEAVLNNNKMELRKKGFMTKHQLLAKYIADPDRLNDYQLNFFFIIQRGEE